MMVSPCVVSLHTETRRSSSLVCAVGPGRSGWDIGRQLTRVLVIREKKNQFGHISLSLDTS